MANDVVLELQRIATERAMTMALAYAPGEHSKTGKWFCHDEQGYDTPHLMASGNSAQEAVDQYRKAIESK